MSFCNKEVPIVYKSTKEVPESVKSSYLISDGNIRSQEQYEENIDYAKRATKENVKILRESFFENGILTLELNCTAKEQHKFNVIFMLDEKGHLTKIGQNPSIREFDNSTKRYKSIMKGKQNKLIMTELSTSVGLKSHGVGVGSYVYLRRIFENLIFDQFEIYLNENPSANKDEFLIMRMNEKIEFLKDYLPQFLVNNKVLYGILSQGIHELSDQDCLDNYDTVYAAIVYILEQKLEIDEINNRKKLLEKDIQKIASK